MRRTRLAAAAIAAFAVFSVPALAAEGGDAAMDKLDPARIAGRMLTEENLSLLFGFLRQSIDAAAHGRTPPQPPPELAKRMEEAEQRLRKDGAAAGLSMLDVLEGEIRRSLREDLRD